MAPLMEMVLQHDELHRYWASLKDSARAVLEKVDY
jgi:hypothetical protein